MGRRKGIIWKEKLTNNLIMSVTLIPFKRKKKKKKKPSSIQMAIKSINLIYLKFIIINSLRKCLRLLITKK